MFCSKFIFICITLCCALLINASFAIAGCGLNKIDESLYEYSGQALNKAPLWELLYPPSMTSTKKPRKKKGTVEINFEKSESGPKGNFSLKGTTNNSRYHLDGHGSINRNNDTNHYEGGIKGRWQKLF